MPSHKELSQNDADQLETGGDVSKDTKRRRKKSYDYLDQYLRNTIGNSISDLLGDIMTEETREVFSKNMGLYFWSYQVKDENIDRSPRLNTLMKQKSLLKSEIIQRYKVDITNPISFPEDKRRWHSLIARLNKEGLSLTNHKDDAIDPADLGAIIKLFNTVVDVLNSRGADNYGEKLLGIPPEWHQKLSYLLQYAAAFILEMFDVKRGVVQLWKMTRSDIVLYEENNIKFWKKVTSDSDKNDGGLIPFKEVAPGFNPGYIFGEYLKFLPEAGTIENRGGFIFQKPKESCKTFNIHDRNEFELYQPNQTVGRNTMTTMLPNVCEVLGISRYTNYQIRVTAIKFMERNGLSLEFITKISDLKNVSNLVAPYGDKLDENDMLEDGDETLAQYSFINFDNTHDTPVPELNMKTEPELLNENYICDTQIEQNNIDNNILASTNSEKSNTEVISEEVDIHASYPFSNQDEDQTSVILSDSYMDIAGSESHMKMESDLDGLRDTLFEQLNQNVLLEDTNIEDKVLNILTELSNDDQFTDVTLISADNKKLKAHKAILSASSSFFKDILINNPHQYPLLYMGGVSYKDLKGIIDFIYLSETTVSADHVEQFLKVANDLRIKGLESTHDKPKGKKKKQKIKGPEKLRVPKKYLPLFKHGDANSEMDVCMAKSKQKQKLNISGERQDSEDSRFKNIETADKLEQIKETSDSIEQCFTENISESPESLINLSPRRNYDFQQTGFVNFLENKSNPLYNSYGRGLTQSETKQKDDLGSTNKIIIF